MKVRVALPSKDEFMESMASNGKPKLTGLKVLVIDDSEDDRLLYRRSLKKSTGLSCAVTEAASGEDGLACIDREEFACVLLDYSLPGRNDPRTMELAHLDQIA